MLIPKITLLHASPLRNTFETSSEGEDGVQDVEKEQERQLVLDSLLRAGKKCVLQTRPLTRESLKLALQTCHILLLGAHGVPGGGIVVETNVFEGEILTVQELSQLLKELKGTLLCYIIFVSSCYSDLAGEQFHGFGVPHVITISGQNQVSNLISRSFFAEMLFSLFGQGCTVAEAVEKGLVCVETHKDLPPHRQVRQREKFVYRATVQQLDANHRFPFSFQAGTVRLEEDADLCQVLGFNVVDVPWPIFGRHSTVVHILESLLGPKQSRCTLLHQTEPGLGSSLVCAFVATYLATRGVFAHMCVADSFVSAKNFYLLSSSSSLSPSLLIVDPVNSQGEMEFWQVVESTITLPVALLVVFKSLSLPSSQNAVILLPPLEDKYATQLQNYCLGENCTQQQQQQVLTNPSLIIARAKQERLTPSLPSALMCWQAISPPLFPPVWMVKRRLLTDQETAFVIKQSIEWMRITLQTLVFVEPDWHCHLILGFVSSTESLKLLQHKSVGTFLLRFTEATPGSLTLCYVGKDKEVEKVQLTVSPTSGFVTLPRSTGTASFPSLRLAVKSLSKLVQVVVSLDGQKVRLVQDVL